MHAFAFSLIAASFSPPVSSRGRGAERERTPASFGFTKTLRV